MEGGGEILAHTGAKPTRGKRLLVVLSDNDDRPRSQQQRKNHAKKYKFIEPVQCMHGPKKRNKSYVIEEICSKCGESTTAEMKKQLRVVNMSEDDINRVSQLYLAYTAYEKSVDALILPHFSDPIYRVPELPLGLREALKGVEMNRGMLL